MSALVCIFSPETQKRGRPADSPLSGYLFAFDCSRFLLLRHTGGRRNARLVIPVGHQAGTGGDQLTDDDVLLQANQMVNLALDGGIGQNLTIIKLISLIFYHFFLSKH